MAAARSRTAGDGSGVASGRPRASAARRIDVAFIFAPYVDHALASRCVGTEYLIAALPERHKLATSSTVDLRALAREPLILPTRHETPGLFPRIRQLLDTAGIDPVIVQRGVWMMHTIVGLVAAKIGVRVAIVPSSAAALRLPGAHAAGPPSR